MKQKELGKTGVLIPEIGLGTWEYKGGIEPLKKGIQLGASLIDTAEAYGTEEVVGEAIRGLRDLVFVATKVSANHLRRAEVFHAAEHSLKRLNIAQIDLYQLHWPSKEVPIEETMAAMEELVDTGKVRFLGVCNFSLTELLQAQRALRKNKIVSNQVPYSLLDRAIENGLLEYCQAQGIAVIAYSPLARGLGNILRKDPNHVLRDVAILTGKTEAQVALNWCISREGVIAIPKADKLDHVTENCDASGWQLSPEENKLLESSFRRRGPVELAIRRIARRVLYIFRRRELNLT